MDDTSKTSRIVLSVDVGGSHVKCLTSAGGTPQKADSGSKMSASQMCDAVNDMMAGQHYDCVTIGFPGPVIHNRPISEPHNLGSGWVGFDYAAALGKPVRIVNDALMQALGSYDGGRMLFLGLGTGLGAAMIVDGIAEPMELAHLPYKKGKTFEDYVGEASRKKRGNKHWRKTVFDIVERITAALEPDYVVIGGGNVDHLKELPPKCRRGDNDNAFAGGFRVWANKGLTEE
ncbi:ROK family protein [Devosia aquimaris]|uniref:ROK family protein n=1 Tax=Devosia aquimaris TaxID=2866214 RepID=UPI001CD0FAA0|nr:ROK family protein [Devosia sp. CJK-A8-3]